MSACAVLIGNNPGAYASVDAATAAGVFADVKYFFMKRCASLTDAELECIAFFDGDDAGNITCVYTDGACRGNGTRAAQAGVGVFWDDDDARNVSRRVRGAPTNNVAELEAIEDALDGIAASTSLSKSYRVITDSLYAIQALQVWYDGWKARGWKTAAGTPVKNLTLICRIHDKLSALGARCRVQLVHVRGHTGVPGNVAADALAVAGSLLCP
jgi:ribonuclease HI